MLSRHWSGRAPITPLFSWCCKIYVPCKTPGLARQAALLRRDFGGVLPFLEPKGTDSESYYLSSSHSRLIRCLTITGLANEIGFHQTCINESGNTNQVILPHEGLHAVTP